MLLPDGKIYVPNQPGDVFVLRADPQFELLATNSVAEPTNASLAASEGNIFQRRIYSGPIPWPQPVDSLCVRSWETCM